MIIENSKLKNRNHKEDIDFRRALLDKHSQFMRMYLRNNNIKMAKEQFEIIKPIFTFLNNEGETMNYYTLEDFELDSKRFKKWVSKNKGSDNMEEQYEQIAKEWKYDSYDCYYKDIKALSGLNESEQ